MLAEVRVAPEPEIDVASAFIAYQKSAASRLRYELTAHGLETLHDLTRPLRVLDAASGNGITSEFLLRRGHEVTLFDVDPVMLREAEDRLGPAGLLQRCKRVIGDVGKITTHVRARDFDLVLCHHLIEYLQNPQDVFRQLAQVVKADGHLSLITLNPVSEVVRRAVFDQDASAAESRLTDLTYDAQWFGPARLYSADDVLSLTRASGWVLGEYRGIRILADYISEAKTDRDAGAVLRLERQLGGLDPYRQFGRYLQFQFSVGSVG